jgi:hypothetical protein
MPGEHIRGAFICLTGPLGIDAQERCIRGIKKKEIPVIWIGRWCLVPRRALEKMLEGASGKAA